MFLRSIRHAPSPIIIIIRVDDALNFFVFRRTKAVNKPDDYGFIRRFEYSYTYGDNTFKSRPPRRYNEKCRLVDISRPGRAGGPFTSRRYALSLSTRNSVRTRLFRFASP